MMRSHSFDFALVTAPEILDLLLKNFPVDRIIFGSDTPYAAEAAVLGFNAALDRHPLGEELEGKIARGNALDLFPRMKEEVRK
jgi:predicted TIM-barrel fold metal-dependent hydrolase